MLSESECRVIEGLSLIKNILKYIVNDLPAVPKKKENKHQSKLEEELLTTKSRQESGKTPNLEFIEQALFELKSQFKGINHDFSLDIKREKGKEDRHNFYIKYQENEKEERLRVEADDGKQKYSLEIKREKPIHDKKPYELSLLYESSKTEEKIGISYSLRDYPTEREIALQDFTKQLDKTLHIIPKSIMGGVLGYTYLGENFMARRDDLTGDKALMVDVHEAIHTPDEYETRVLTDWILTRERMKYKK